MSSPGLSGSGAPLPAFKLHDLDGRAWSETDLAGLPTVLFCFSTW